MIEANDKDLKLCHDMIFLCHNRATNLGKTMGIYNAINEVRANIGKSINTRI